MKNLKTLFVLATLLAATASANAASHAGASMGMSDARKPDAMPMAASTDMADGEVRKVDMENKKITIKHGAIKNLDMPGMTMVFQVKDVAMLDKVKAGDKVRFAAEKAGGALVVIDIQLAK